MRRYDIINTLIKKNNYKKYLEIGIQEGICFRHVNCEYKVGVDPALDSSATFKITSDEFFKNLNKNEKFDIIFIDGLHTSEQVDKDIENSLNVLNENGVILLHDCNPLIEDYAKEYPIHDNWMGTVYLSIIKLRLYRDDLSITTIDTDAGVGILKRNKSNKINYKYEESMNWNFFEKNRNEILNLISVEDFQKVFNID
jgi:hypothetical protein